MSLIWVKVEIKMQVTETLSDGLKRGFSVVVPASEIERKTTKKLAEIGRTMKLPGFRPGKVPQSLIRQRFGRDVVAEVMQTELNEATDRVITERNLRPAGRPKVDLVGELTIDVAKPVDLAFTVEMELLPEIALPDLAALSLTRLRAEVAADAVDGALANVAKSRAAKVTVTEERGAETGDVLTVDFVGRENGEEFDGGKGNDADIEIGGPGFIPGFAEGMIGMRVGDAREVAVTFPAEYHAAGLAGKDAVFSVTAKALSTREPALIDDALADALGLGTLDELREFVTRTMQRELDQTARLRIKRELLDKLAEGADFPAPSNLLDAEFGGIWQRIEADMAAGNLDEEDRGKDTEVLRAEYRAIAERRVRLGLLLAEIGRANAVTVTEAELNRALQAEMQRYPGQEQMVLNYFRQNQGAVEQLRGPIFEDKVVDYILGVASVDEKLVSVDELNAAIDPPAGLLAAPVEAVAVEASLVDAAPVEATQEA